MPIDTNIKDKIITLIAALIPEAKIYLFGSRARGTHSQWSDIDIALDAGKLLDPRRVAEVSAVLEALSIPYKVDVVDVYSVSDVMQNAIEQEKVIWKA